MDANKAPLDFGSTAMPSDRHVAPVGALKFTPTLVCFEGAERGRTFSLTSVETVIGRSSHVSIILTDSLASRRHARFLYKNWLDATAVPECYLEDLQSSNGTELNGRRIESLVRLRLRERDRIQIGSTVFGYFVKDENEIRLEKALFDQATKDALTGLTNRRRFESQLTHHVENVQRSGRSVALLVIDADRFKSVNDTYGHDVGDQVLIHLGKVISGCCRNHELSARWGGEEFVVLLPDCGAEGARATGERIRRAVESEPVVAGGRQLSVTVSIGGASMRLNEDIASFFRRADQQLLKAKEEGRNRVLIDGLD